MTDLRESGEVSTGELLDNRYVLQERIGEGGMARVYRAEDTHLQRSVAVKVFREPTDGIDSVQRALSETTLLASLSHTHRNRRHQRDLHADGADRHLRQGPIVRLYPVIHRRPGVWGARHGRSWVVASANGASASALQVSRCVMIRCSARVLGITIVEVGGEAVVTAVLVVANGVVVVALS